MTPMRLLVPVLMGLCVQMAIGQTVYRCGDHYTDQPCRGATPVTVQDARSAAQQAQAQTNAARERQLADTLEKRRLHDEAHAAQAAQASVPASPPPAAKPANPAQVKQARRARWKVRRSPTVRPQPAVHTSNEPTPASLRVPAVPGTGLTTQ